MQMRWQESLQNEGLPEIPIDLKADSGAPTCPACSFSAPLVDGACADCGLQLD
jgi:hypothetical protein